jgi:protease I
MKLTGRSICMPVAHEFEDVELLYPLLRLSEEGARIVLATYQASFSARPYVGKTKPITGRLGYPVPPVPMVEGRRFDLADMLTLKSENFDAVVIPGGFSPDILRREPYIVDFVHQANAAGKPIGAICHAPWLAISAGIVKGRRVTSWISLKDDLVNAGGLWEDSAVVVDGNLITSRCPDDLPEFCLAIIEALALRGNVR